MNDEIDKLPTAGYEIDYPHKEVKLTTRIRGRTFVEGTDIHELVRKEHVGEITVELWDETVIAAANLGPNDPSRDWMKGYMTALQDMKEKAGYSAELPGEFEDEVDA